MKLVQFPQKRPKYQLTYAEFGILLVRGFESLKNIWDGSIIQPLDHVHRVLSLAVFEPMRQFWRSRNDHPSRRLTPN